MPMLILTDITASALRKELIGAASSDWYDEDHLVQASRAFSGRDLRRGLQSARAHGEWLQMLAVGPERTLFAARLADFRQSRSFASLLAVPSGAEAIVHAIARNDPDTRSKMYEQSLAIQRGFVSLLGHGFISIGNPPHWHADPLNGHEIIRRHWSRIDHLDAAVVGDHKLVWELNRTQYLFAPAFCWLHGRDPQHFDLIQSHLDSWLAENSPGFGINWVSSLEVAYRAIAWCWLLWMLRDAPWNKDLHGRLTTSLQMHALHIERYLSTYYSPNTHLTGEALGLFYIGSVLPSARRAAVWRNKGSEILEQWLERQVYPDGVYFEQACQYHRYTTEIYLHYKLLADSTDWKVSNRVSEVLGRLLDVIRTLASGSGRMPLIGDDDGGALLPLDLRTPDDVRALLLVGAVALNRPDLAESSKSSPTLAYWLCGIDSTDQLMQMPAVSPRWRDIYFARGGVAVLRDGWSADAAVAVINAGPHGALSCAHGHADALAMTLALGSYDLFIERGTFTYTGPQRNEFRSTESHNTLEIDHESSAVPGSPFRWLTIPPPACGSVYTAAEFTGFKGVANSHGSGTGISMHQRTVLHWRGGAWIILDRGGKPARVPALSGGNSTAIKCRAFGLARRIDQFWDRSGNCDSVCAALGGAESDHSRAFRCASAIGYPRGY